jgi:polysaccharide pyruvyl transferase WcaK-like protein
MAAQKKINNMKSETAHGGNDAFSVCLLGAALDVGNQGCCALAFSLIKLIMDTKPNARIYLLYGNHTGGTRQLQISGETIEVGIVNYRLSPRASLSEHLLWILFLAFIQRIIPIKSIRDKIVKSNRWLRTLKAADFVGDIRAGDSFSDIYGLRRFLFGIIPSIVAILLRKKLVMLPQTYGPFKSAISKQVARFVMTHSTKLLSRDQDSIELVQKMLGEKRKHKTIQLCPDVAFVLEPILPNNPDIQPKLNRINDVPLIGLNISSLLYVGGFTRNNMFGLKFNYKEFIHILLHELLDRTKADILLVPHEYFKFMIDGQDCSEIQVCEKERELINERYRERIHLVKREYNQNEIKGIIGLCDFFIGSRMHACIGALSQGKATVGLAYSKKFAGVFQTIGAEKYVIDMRQKEQRDIIEMIMSCFEKRDAISENIKSAVHESQKRIRNIFRDMLCNPGE